MHVTKAPSLYESVNKHQTALCCSDIHYSLSGVMLFLLKWSMQWCAGIFNKRLSFSHSTSALRSGIWCARHHNMQGIGVWICTWSCSRHNIVEKWKKNIIRLFLKTEGKDMVVEYRPAELKVVVSNSGWAPKNFQHWLSLTETQQPVDGMQCKAKGYVVLSVLC